MEDLQEVPVLAAVGKGLAVAGKAVAKGVAVAAKAGAKAGSAAAKGGSKVASTATKGGSKVANTTGKGAKKATEPLKDRMPKGFDKNKDLIKGKKGLPSTNKPKSRSLKNTTGKETPPSKKISDSGKQTIDPSKNTTTKKPDDSSSSDVSKDIDQSSEDKTKEGHDDKVKDRAQDFKKKVGDAAKDAGKRVKRYVGRTTSAFGTTSFAKEGITFKDYLNKL